MTAGKAQIYTPAGPLKSGDTDRRADEARSASSRCRRPTPDNPLDALGRIAITGAARSPDGTRVVLRTYADAFECDVTDGDVVAALTSGKPRVTPLPHEPVRRGDHLQHRRQVRSSPSPTAASSTRTRRLDILGYTPVTRPRRQAGGRRRRRAEAGRPSPGSTGLSLSDITYLSRPSG